MSTVFKFVCLQLFLVVTNNFQCLEVLLLFIVGKKKYDSLFRKEPLIGAEVEYTWEVNAEQKHIVVAHTRGKTAGNFKFHSVSDQVREAKHTFIGI